jgi:DNA-binding LacI/PurR family transcriptional regulator
MKIVTDEPTSLPTVSPTVARNVSPLQERIEGGAYRAGEWLPTERALAGEFGVSRILIRSAVKELERRHLVVCHPNCRPLVREVVSVEAPPTAQPTISPQAAITTRRNLALWIWPQPSWPGSAMTIRGIQEAAGREYRLVLESPEDWNDLPAAESRFLRHVAEHRDAEGIILAYTGRQANLPDLKTLRAAGVPLVFLDHRPPEGFGADYVGVDNRRGAEQIVRHLLALGHRSIAHVSNFDDISTVAERLAGYRRALARAGIPYRPELVQKDPGPPPGGDANEGCETMVDYWMGLREPPTAIFAVSDIVAYRVIHSLRACGLRVPEDVSVAGFDGIERWVPGQAFLTTVHQPFDDMGFAAVELLLDRIKAGPDAPYRHVILDVPFVANTSTGPVPRRSSGATGAGKIAPAV